MKVADRYRVKPGVDVKLEKWDPDDMGGVSDKKEAKKKKKENTKRLWDLQYLMYAEGKRSLLIVLQAMDAGGKDGTIRHVMGGLNPQGCRVTSFKGPTSEELDHDFLWRIHKVVPRKGEIGIFNRSHYEDVLIVRVHNLVGEKVWSKRYEQMNQFEKMLSSNQVHILKFFLYISKDEQLNRFQSRIDEKEKHWKVRPEDFEERGYWDDYMKAYEEALGQCSTEWAPWFVVPANHKWYRNFVVSEILVEYMENLGMSFPKASCDVSKLKIK